MIISKDLFIFGEQIFATIIPESASSAQQLGSAQTQMPPQSPAAQLTTQSAIISNITTTTTSPSPSVAINTTTAATATATSLPAAIKNVAGAGEQVEVMTAGGGSDGVVVGSVKEQQQQQQESMVAINAGSNININNNNNSQAFAVVGGNIKKIKIQKLPKEAESELKIQIRKQQQREQQKCETTTTTTATTKRAHLPTFCKKKKQNSMNLFEEESRVGNESIFDDVAEQEPLVKPQCVAKIITTTTTRTTTTPSPSRDCCLFLEPEGHDDALTLNIAASKPVASSGSASSASSSSPSSSSSASASSSITSQTTIPSSVNLSTNMEKSSSLLIGKSAPDHQHHRHQNHHLDQHDHDEHATAVTFPFIAEQQQQQQHQQQQLQQQPTLQLTFQGINVLHNERKILTDVSGLVSPGEVLAIMGPSGSGKTTLLDCLSGQRRIDAGGIYLNREPLSKKWRRRIGYVLQEEIFFTQLTLRETVMYTALLRLPETMPKAEKVRLVDRILEMLELSFCQQTKIGDYLNRGLSGGEKKRANIACELLTNPLLMLLDEPTSGLDSHSAISLMKVLKRYAFQEQKTIVITVHQPSSQMFHMFDKLLLLHNGRTAYFGDVNNIYKHFEGIGVSIKPHYNPADFVLEQLKSYPDIREKLFNAAKESHGNIFNRSCNYTVQANNQHNISKHHQRNGHSNGDQQQQQQDQQHKVNGVLDKTQSQNNILINDMINNYYKQQHQQHQQQHNHLNHNHRSHDEEAAQHLVWCGADSQSNFSSSGSSDCQSYRDGGGNGNGSVKASNGEWLDYPTRFHTQFRVLSSRNFKEAKPRMLSKLNWFQTIGLALMAGAIWFQIPRTEEFLHDLQGWMFFSQTYWMLFALFGALNSFPSEREVISKERRAGAYRLSAYYLAKMFGELPLVITLPTVYLMISYPMLGCSSLKLFFLMLIFLLLNTMVAQSVGFFIGACCMDMNVSITLSALYTLATQLFGGYLSSRIPEALSWIRYTSMIHYAYQNMQILEFREGLAIKCGTPSSYEVCKSNATTFIPYEEILEAQNSNPLWLNTLVLMMFLLVFRSLGYAVLRYVRCPKT